MQQHNVASLPVGVLSFYREKRGNVTLIFSKCIFHFILNTPILFHDKAPDDGLKLNAAIDTVM